MDKITLFWNGFEPIWRILLVGTLTYIFIVFFLRVSGKRALTNMNAFDFIITIAIGSSFGRILTARKVALAESFTTFALLFLLQFIISWLEIRYKGFSRLITARPTLLYHKEEFLYTNMRRVRIGKDKLIVAVRKKGMGSLEKIEAIIMETDGQLSIIQKANAGDMSALDGVEGTEASTATP